MENRFDKYVGLIFDRRYKITKVIGVGGMAVVFEAVDLVMHRTVAVKMLKDDIANDAASVKRFINESKAVSMLSHPNIVSICDVSVRDNIKYIVMELIDGITLKRYMTKKGVLSLRETINISQQILRALEHAHSKGIVHRDIKPQNIMMLRNGQIKVTDFGIARLPHAENVTVTDKAVGTVFYISPEQASAKQIDQRSDLYSLGIMMYEMMTGKLPFTSDNPLTVAMMQVNRAPKPPRDLNPEIPLGMEQIIMTAIEKKPERRFQTAGAMLRCLDQIKTNPHLVFTPRASSKTGQTNAVGVKGSKAQTGMPKKRPIARKQNKSMLPIIMGVTTAFFLVALIGGIFLLNNVLHSESKELSVTVENYVGMTLDASLKNQLEDLKYYKLQYNYVYNDDQAANTVLSQTPSAGSNRKVIPGKQYTDLTLTVSRGTESIALSDYSITEYRDTKIELDALGIKCEIVKEDNDTVPEGYVIRTEPAAGTVLTHQDTVTLYVSKGQQLQKVIVPDLVKLTAAQASTQLKTGGLNIGSVEYMTSETVAKGKVISQSVTPSSQVYKGTKINIVISLGPAAR